MNCAPLPRGLSVCVAVRGKGVKWKTPLVSPHIIPAGIFRRCSCLKGWLLALGVGSRPLMVFQGGFVRSERAPSGGLRSSPRVIYYLSPPPAALRLRGRCQQRRWGALQVVYWLSTKAENYFVFSMWSMLIRFNSTLSQPRRQKQKNRNGCSLS